MEVPPQVSFRGVEPSDRVKARIQEEIDKLERYFDRITSCRVVVDVPHARHESGNLYQVRIDVAVPGKELVVSRDPPRDQAREDLVVAIKDAFEAMQRQLQDYARKLRGDVKAHQEPPRGRVAKIFPSEGYGFIRTPDGREVYFHENSLVDGGMDDVEVGREVRFVEQQGREGPQASTVHLA